MVQLNPVPVFGAKKIPVPFDGNFSPKFRTNGKRSCLQVISTLVNFLLFDWLIGTHCLIRVVEGISAKSPMTLNH